WPKGQLDALSHAWLMTLMTKISGSVAIVDDDPGVLKALARLLSARSFVTRTYLSGPQFLVSLPDGVPDYLIVDLQMPEMNALELQHDLARRGIKIPTIIITAHDEAGMQERCMSAGAIAYLSKPVHGTTLLAAIDASDTADDQWRHEAGSRVSLCLI